MMFYKRAQQKTQQFEGILDDQVIKIEADIKAQVGQFLQFPSKLIPFRNSADPKIREEANKLLERNNELEIELNKTLDFIDELKAQGLSATTLFANTGQILEAKRFLGDFKDHKNKVNRFLQTGGAAGSSGMLPDGDNMFLLAATAGVVGLGAWLLKKYKKG